MDIILDQKYWRINCICVFVSPTINMGVQKAKWRSKLINPTIIQHHEEWEEHLIEEMSYHWGNDEENKIKKRLLEKKNKGEQIFKNIVRTLTDTKNIRLLPYQIKFVETCVKSSLPKLYGSEWDKNRKRILKTYGIKDFHPEVFFVSGRRMGKTLSLAMLVCTLAMCIPSDGVHPLKIAVFSINQGASYRFIDECNSALRCLKGIGRFIIDKTRGKIRFINIEDPDDIREIEGFCGKGNVSIFLNISMNTATATTTTTTTTTTATMTLLTFYLGFSSRNNKGKVNLNKFLFFNIIVLVIFL